jgi:hypothetical protein
MQKEKENCKTSEMSRQLTTEKIKSRMESTRETCCIFQEEQDPNRANIK